MVVLGGFEIPVPRWWVKPPAALVPPVPHQLLEHEISRLGPHRTLCSQGCFDVLLFTARDAPALLLEVGRLRELTFRGAGEGTGRSYDLDRFDERYEQLVLWDRDGGQVAGAYRITRVDPVAASRGALDLYTQTLFRLSPGFFRELGPSAELGRSFITPDYQRKPLSLLLLWRGIGAYLERYPQCQALFGAVSISRSYPAEIRQSLADYFASHAVDDPLRPHVQARRRLAAGGGVKAEAATIEAIDRAARQLGSDGAAGRGIPVLLRQYLKLGGRVIDCSVDPSFGDCLDSLIAVDLRWARRDRITRLLNVRDRLTNSARGAGLDLTVPGLKSGVIAIGLIREALPEARI